MTKPKRYLKIGEIFTHYKYGHITPVETTKDNCKGCVFNYGGVCKDSNSIYPCNKLTRPDNKTVVFIKT